MNRPDDFTDAQLRAYLLGRLSELDRTRLENALEASPDLAARLKTTQASDELTQLVNAAAAARQKSDYTHWTQTEQSTGSMWTAGSLAVSEPAALDDDSSDRRHNATPPSWLLNHPRYEVHQLLGVGGMGRVWLARHKVMGRLVALKTMRSSLLKHRHAVERFLREVQAAAKLSHPNIAAAYDAEQIDDVYLLAMEYVPGRTLASIVRREPLTVADACRAIRDAAAGLAHAHAAGLVHRDIKPGNLIQTPAGIVKVLDFGLVVISDSDSSITGDNLVMGTPDYIAPEQAEDARTADARSDLYSLGCTLYCLLNGRPPFADSSPVRKIDQHRTGKAARLPNVPAELNGLIEKLMQKDPRRRFQSADELHQSLEPWCRDDSTPNPLAPLQSSVRRRAGLMALAGCVTALGAGPWLIQWLNRKTNGGAVDGGLAGAKKSDGSANRDLSANPDSRSASSEYKTRIVEFKDMTETRENSSPVDGYTRDATALHLTARLDEPQVWLDFTEVEFSDVTLDCRLRVSAIRPFSYVKFSFLSGDGNEVNAQFLWQDGQPKKLAIVEWEPLEETLREVVTADDFAEDWVAFQIRIDGKLIFVSVDGVEKLRAGVKRHVPRKLALSAQSANADFSDLRLTCLDPA